MSTTPKPPRRSRLAHVVEVEQLTPGMVRIVFGGEGLEGFTADEFTDYYVKLQFPPAGASYTAPFDTEDVKTRFPREQWPRMRSYTVRAWDPARLRLTIDFVVHGESGTSGVAGPWAAAAQPGDALQMLGPGGSYAPDPSAAVHLMIGDASVIPAIAASLERVPAGVPVHVLVQVDAPEERQPLQTPGELHLTWAADDAELLRTLRLLALPREGVQAFVHGEAGVVRELRRHLLGERRMPREALSVSGYWKRTLVDEEWRASKRAWNAEVEQDVAPA